MLDGGEKEPKSVSRQAAEELNLVSFVRGSVDYKRKALEARLEEILRELQEKGEERNG